MLNKYNFILTNCDTDSISMCNDSGLPFTNEEKEFLLDEINNLLPELIFYEDDGYFSHFLVLKAKNYVILEDGGSPEKIKKKGSSITDKKKEPALLEMIDKFINDIMFNDSKELVNIYHSYIKEVLAIKNISRWCSKVSVTKSVLNAERSTEQKKLDALSDIDIQEGDKYWVFNDIDGQIPVIMNKTSNQYTALKYDKKTKKYTPKLEDNTILRHIDTYDGSYNMIHYLGRVYKTVEIFKNVLDITKFTNYTLKKNFKLLEKI